MPFITSFERKQRAHRQARNAPKKTGGQGRGWRDALRLEATGTVENKFAQALENLVQDRIARQAKRIDKARVEDAKVMICGADPNRCYYCGCEVIDGLRTPKGKLHAQSKTRDHIVPRMRGGRRTVTACHRCNSRKGAMSLEEFRKKERPDSDPLFWAEKQHQGYARDTPHNK